MLELLSLAKIIGHLKNDRKIYVALPVKNELENIANCIRQIVNQNYKIVELWVCVNQPDKWWDDDEKKGQCENNQKTIDFLKSVQEVRLKILDYSSRGKGWQGKREGIGWARKVLMDKVAEIAKPDDIILSMDADTNYDVNYFSSVVKRYDECSSAMSLLNPYTHQLTDDDDLNRNMLRYEMYMRHYIISLWQIGSPYAFAAMGSTISCPVWAYKKTGGMIPKKSGEDFYFIQNIVKTGNLLRYNDTKVYPGTRYSDRVYFGTGPALIKGKNNDWSSYPIYPDELFRKIQSFYELLPNLYLQDMETPLDGFIETTFGTKSIWEALRANYKDETKFIRACHAKIDGLRILQFLKSNHEQSNELDDAVFKSFIKKNFLETVRKKDLDIENFSFWNSNIETLNEWRNLLFEIESAFQKTHYMRIKHG